MLTYLLELGTMITTANKRTSAITKGPCNSAKLIFYIKVNNDSPHKLSFLWQWQSGSVNEVRCSASSMCNGTLHWKQLLWHKKTRLLAFEKVKNTFNNLHNHSRLSPRTSVMFQ